MQWSLRQARYTLLLFMLLFTAGQVKVHLTKPVYPSPGSIPAAWPPGGHLVDATALSGRAIEVFPSGTIAAGAIRQMGLHADPSGSGHCLPGAGKLVPGEKGWKVRPMSQRERWVWRIPMDLYRCKPDDLERIKGIGPSLGNKIYMFVQGRGALDSLDVLDEVAGVGPGKLSVLKKELALN